ncbi:MAG: GTP-binding protein [Candidatus Heimdallarchaeaceae archaeon]
MNQAEYVFKITLIGDGAVGKTSIRNRFMGHGFSSSHLMTLGADFSVIDKQILPNEIWKFQIWDLAGQPIFEQVRPRFYKGSMGALLVFDITNKQSFRNCLKWVKELYRFCGKEAVPIVMLANKADLRNNKSVKMKQAEKFIKILNEGTASYGIVNTVLETSAKTGKNIDLAFETLGRAIRGRF